MDIVEFLSRLLRANPPEVGLPRDRRGWIEISAVLSAIHNSGHTLDRRGLHRVVQGNQTRFAISRDGSRIRALQDRVREALDPPAVEDVPPSLLYHGTAAHYLDSIARNGLVAGTRKFVHVCESPKLAMEAGSLHGEPELLAVRAARMLEQRFVFYRAGEGIWLVRSAPARFLVRW
ncbi:MAG: putative 2-phosphotransferase [Herminiimonas sp.]|nr:putative 2-phosphotransferase [Herminiimonas sp.]MDB5854524.1 putative 2-phosphotransferase [Herminiimonas sp.]